MNAPYDEDAMRREVSDALAWLRANAAADAQLHADTRTLAPGDVFFAYAVDGADSRPHIAAAFERGAGAVLYQPEGFSGSADPVTPPRHGEREGGQRARDRRSEGSRQHA